MSLQIITDQVDAVAADYKAGLTQKELYAKYISYEGQKPNLEGVEVLAKYASNPKDNQVFTIKNATFYTVPEFATGVIGQVPGGGTPTYQWNAMRGYDLMMIVEGKPRLVGTVTLAGVVPFTRDANWKVASGSGLPDNGFPFTDNSQLLWDNGIDLLGPIDSKIYVDDYPKLDDYTLQYHYADGTDSPIFKVTPGMQWQVRPTYDNPDETGPGQFIVKVGDNPLTETAYVDSGSVVHAHPYVLDALGTLTWPAGLKYGLDPAIIKSKQYAEVYTVKKNGLKVLNADGSPFQFDNYYYWQGDESIDWIDRLIAKDAKLTVEYTNNTTKDFTVKEAKYMNEIWHNVVPGNAESTGLPDPDMPFGVLGIDGTAYYKSNQRIRKARNTDPRVRVNYRGGIVDIQTPVFTALESIAARPKDGNPILVDMRQRDNDVAGMNATEFSKKVIVEATFTAYSNPELRGVLPLKFDETRFVPTSGTVGYTPDPNEIRPAYDLPNTDSCLGEDYYSMNFGKPSWWNKDKDVAGTSPLQKGDWESDWSGTLGNPPIKYEPYKDFTNGGSTYTFRNYKGDVATLTTAIEGKNIPGYGVCDTTKNNGNTASLRFYYRPPVDDNAGVTSPRRGQYIMSDVSWTNIRSR